MSIKDWSEEDKPREKLLSNDSRMLTDTELLAIIIGSAGKGETVMDLARRLLDESGGLYKLSKLSAKELTKYKGIGTAKAVSVVAAFELGKRVFAAKKERVKITSAKDVFFFMCKYLCAIEREELWIMLLNVKNEVLSIKQIAIGGVNRTSVDNKLLFSYVLRNYATSIIVCHNHPSGDLSPSNADISFTHRLFEASKLLDINLLDHIIIGENNYYSFAENGKLFTL